MSNYIVFLLINHYLTSHLLNADEFKATNLVMIMFDDLRPELSIYGRPYMITPNFERLAAKSVTFDYAYCQVAVCNPSRDSLMTGLRPDSVGTYNFQHSFRPHLTLPEQLGRSGYNTAGYGKIFHWETNDKNIWNYDHWDNDWYKYQGAEHRHMNASTMFDAKLPEDQFRDSLFVQRTLTTWQKLIQIYTQSKKPYMLALGFKLPHLDLHIPQKYYDLYMTPARKQLNKGWQVRPKKELRFPPSSSEISYHCCAEPSFSYMRSLGSVRANKTMKLTGDINQRIPEEMYQELMLGYITAITFVDSLLSKLLDFMDEHQLWETTTFVLTADHGMHNGEKGIWDKWTLFEESTRVPLLIHHPLSPFQGQHYPYPVELIDVYQTLNQLLVLPIARERTCAGYKCKPLQGKSLAPILLGQSRYEQAFGSSSSQIGSSIYRFTSQFIQSFQHYQLSANQTAAAVSSHQQAGSASNKELMPALEQTFAISQTLRCAPRQKVAPMMGMSSLILLAYVNQSAAIAMNKQSLGGVGGVADSGNGQLIAAGRGQGSSNDKGSKGNKGDKTANSKIKRSSPWTVCDKNKVTPATTLAVMGYAMRTPEYRYVAYFHYNLTKELPRLDLLPYDEELYDHKNETLADFSHRELVNLVMKPALYAKIIESLRKKLIDFIETKVKFGDH